MFLLPQTSQTACFAHPKLSLSRLSYIKSFSLPPFFNLVLRFIFHSIIIYSNHLSDLFEVSSRSLPRGLEPLPWWKAESPAQCMTEAYSSVSIRKALIHSCHGILSLNLGQASIGELSEVPLGLIDPIRVLWSSSWWKMSPSTTWDTRCLKPLNHRILNRIYQDWSLWVYSEDAHLYHKNMCSTKQCCLS